MIRVHFIRVETNKEQKQADKGKQQQIEKDEKRERKG